MSSQLTCTSILDCTLEEVRRYNADPRNVGTTQNISLVIDGRTLSMALSPDLQGGFLELAKHCRSVLCCRVTPLQKSGVVKLVREKLKVMTLAVGKHAPADQNDPYYRYFLPEVLKVFFFFLVMNR